MIMTIVRTFEKGYIKVTLIEMFTSLTFDKIFTLIVYNVPNKKHNLCYATNIAMTSITSKHPPNFPAIRKTHPSFFNNKPQPTY